MPEEKLTYCPAQGTPYLKLDSQVDKVRYIVKARCKQWTCPYCQEVNRHQHYIRILNGTNELLNAGYNLNFVTLTSHRKVRGLLPSYRVWQSAWKKLSERARRKNAKTSELPLEYVYIPETHRDGTLHIHGVFTGNLSERWWKDNSPACGLGYQVRSVPLENGIQATNYCLKYVSKSVGQKIDIKRFRRVNYSSGFPAKPTDTRKLGFEVLPTKTAIIDVIREGWYTLDFDVYLNSKLVEEIEYRD